MIQTTRELACAALGALLIIAIVTYKEPWALVPLTLLIPWHKLFLTLDHWLEEWYKERQESQFKISVESVKTLVDEAIERQEKSWTRK